MNNEINLVVDVVSNEKNVSKEIVFEALEAALESATKKLNGAEWDVKVVIDRQTGEYETFRIWTVIDENAVDDEGYSVGVQNPDAELTLAQGQEKQADIQVGETIEEPIESVAFGRIAAQTAKQVIMQRLRAAKREQIADEYEQKVGQLVSGSVKKVTRDFIVVDLGNNAEGLLKRSEMLPKEMLRIGDRIRALLQEVQRDQRGPQLLISRTCPEMLIELFKIEVPEIGDGLIEVKGAARDPGARAKIAVLAKDTRIDPVGACVGMRGARVQAVSNELGGERVDIVLWDADPAKFVINALAPAEIASIIFDEDKDAMDVVVEESQQSAAIGRGGQNVRLAGQLTDWELNVVSEKQAEEREQEEMERLTKLFANELHVDENIAIALVEAGFSSIEEIAYVPMQELMEVEGTTEDDLISLRARSKDYLLTQAIEQEERVDEKTPSEDLLSLDGMDRQLAYQIATHNVLTRDDLAELAVDDLVEMAEMDEEKAAKLIMAARAHWFIEN